MKKTLLITLSLLLMLAVVLIAKSNQTQEQTLVKIERKSINPTQQGKKKTLEERARYDEARNLYEYYRQVNPITGIISKADKNLELMNSKRSLLKKDIKSAKIPETTYSSRGPSNLGGRTRAVVVDRSDATGNTLIAGGVSGGVFRTTNGGTSWTKVSANDEIHNVTTIVQDPRSGFESTWYYGTGEGLGNSASKSGAFYFGQGIWQSTNGGLTWAQMPSTSSGSQEVFDNVFDIIFNLAVHPTTGELFAAVVGRIMRFDGFTWTTERDGSPSSTSDATDIAITSSGRVYAAFSGTHDASIEGVWTSSTGNSTTGIWSRINASDFTPTGRVVLALAPSNQDKLYTLFVNGTISDCDTTPAVEADLWMWDQSTTTYTNFSSKLPDEIGCSDGNDPFGVQGGYDLVVSVKPDDEDFVLIGGTNAYKIEDIVVDATFTRIGGYASAAGYASYSNHHADIHALVFSPFSSNVLFSGTDGGVHATADITAATVAWSSLNNNYQTYQFYHVSIDPDSGSDFVIGGAQDNGTTVGGTSIGASSTTSHIPLLSGDGVSVAIPNYAGCGISFFGGSQNGTLYRYCQNTSGYTEITPRMSTMPDVLYPSQFVTYYHVDPENTNAIYYASEGTLLRSTDGANVTQDTWTSLSDTNTAFGHADYFQAFSTTRGAYDAATSYLLMGGDEGHIYRLNDPQNAVNISTAIDITPPTATIGFPSIVTGLAIHPTNNDIVLATYSNYGTESIFLTTNATNATPTWTLVERNLSAHSIRSAAITEVAGQTLYFVGTARGLYSTSDPTTTDWAREAPTEIGYALVSSLSYRPSDNHLLVGTHGNGMFETVITDNPLNVKHVNNISNHMSLYPNPVENEINLKFAGNYGKVSNYMITNISGQSVLNGADLLSNKIDVTNLQTGIYFIKVKIGDKFGTKKFIKI
ncbi:T9SS type A sorting domain-containing protein [Hwangdonia lutea]|uniref:T9SS type A sorting domain-containing protein n=1 Tax=Hwangdonia lutea TaxID=3075823 RepID=A0AA97HPS8_9FLAO|nr:T9SS type A sorting domain-containing protein [Hwangdonia sp. SCSIO 19198]WOD42165.1 T9SS type A sorting domain-containing protein [Hwangdonia sp. SCSIO 19198]